MKYVEQLVDFKTLQPGDKIVWRWRPGHGPKTIRNSRYGIVESVQENDLRGRFGDSLDTIRSPVIHLGIYCNEIDVFKLCKELADCPACGGHRLDPTDYLCSGCRI